MKRANRILDNKDFQRIIKGKQSFSNKSFIVFHQSNKYQKTRVGISVGVKTLGAVLRNKIKRQIRMMVINNLDLSRPVDIVIMVRSYYQNLNFENNQQELVKLFKKIKEVE